MRAFFVRWVSTTFAVFIATALVPGMTAETPEALLLAGLLLGVLNAVVRPVLLLLSLPVILLSFGLVIPLINALLLEFVGSGRIAGFHVDGFGPALFGALVISLASWWINGFLRDERADVRGATFPAAPPPPQPGEMKSVQGRVIEHEPDSK